MSLETVVWQRWFHPALDTVIGVSKYPHDPFHWHRLDDLDMNCQQYISCIDGKK